MVEVEFTLKSAFSNSFPFSLATSKETKDEIINHAQISASIINFANSLDEKAQNLTPVMIFDYLESIDLKVILEGKVLPPIELLKLKWVCEYLYSKPYIKEIISKRINIDYVIDYFVSVDEDLSYQLKQRKELDKQRYQHKNQKK